MGYYPQNDTNPKRVVLKSPSGRAGEQPASGTVPVGSLLQGDGAGGVVVHGVAGGRAERMFAVERCYQGIGGPATVNAFDNYASGDRVLIQHAEPGDIIYGLLKAGAVSVVDGFLSSAGDGSLSPTPTGSGAQNLYESVADSATITNTAAETDFNKTYAIPANFLQVGDVLHIRGVVTVPNQNSTDTLTLKLYVGTQVIVATAAVDVATNDQGLIDAYFTVRSIGASGTFIANGVEALGIPGTATARPFALGSTSIDTTASKTIKVTATWSNASTSNQAVLSSLSVDLDRITSYSSVAVALDAVDNSASGSNTLFRFRLL